MRKMAIYTRIHFANGTQIVSSNNIGVYKELLIKFGFHVCHKYHIIHMSHIVKYQIEGVIEMVDRSKVALRRRKKDEFLSKGPNEIKLK